MTRLIYSAGEDGHKGQYPIFDAVVIWMNPEHKMHFSRKQPEFMDYGLRLCIYVSATLPNKLCQSQTLCQHPALKIKVYSVILLEEIHVI